MSKSPTQITPTIGRRIWYFPSTDQIVSHDDKPAMMMRIHPDQPFDAGIVFVHEDGKVNLSVTDHNGRLFAVTNVSILPQGTSCQKTADSAGFIKGFAQWMPYQVEAATKKDREMVHTGEPAKTTITTEEIESLMKRVVFNVDQGSPTRTGTTSTFVHAYLDGRFFLVTGHSACVDPSNFDADIGHEIALKKAQAAARDKLWELEGYRLYNNLR